MNSPSPTASGASVVPFPAMVRVPPRGPALSPALPPSEPPVLGHEDTVEDLLTQSGRALVPVRKSFVQQPPGSSSRVGPLAGFVRSRDERGLDAYLFVHALASAEPWTCTYPSATWARVLDLASGSEPESAKAAVSKVFRRLERRGLVARRRVGRLAEVTLLHEDGTGAPYTRPKKAQDGVWLALPYTYWREGHYKALSLPGKAMLLVALSLPDTFVLPQERVPGWYGWSADTAQRGFAELRSQGILSSRKDYVRDHKSPTGWREVQHHQLVGDFSTQRRAAAAKKRRRRRTVEQPAAAV